jgi:phosphatidylglycerol:prolipoprotein diacylglycerol transferase
LLFIVIAMAIRGGALRRAGLVSGLFGIGYGLARIACEFFREPDAQLGYLFGGATMGMLLSLPLIAAGVLLVAYSGRSGPRGAAT